MTLAFPKDFLWGTASAAHQVEGNNTNNQWWAFENQKGTIWYGDRSGLACDWWANAEQDFDRMAAMGMNTHRMSVEWSRIEPEPGEFNAPALDRYRQMLDGLLSRGIQPMVTLHHFSEPLWFVRKGGWENAEAIERFTKFTETVIDALGDLCTFWCTFNEPLVYTTFGWVAGRFPPGKKNFYLALKVIDNMLHGHAEAYHTIHRLQPDAQVGYSKHVRIFTGWDPENLLDRYAAGLKRWLFEHVWVAATKDGWLRPPLQPRHHERLEGTYDYIGLNYYTRDRTRFILNPSRLFGEEIYPRSYELSDAGMDGAFSALDPEGLYEVCREVNEFDPNVPIYITENGVPDRRDRLRPRWLIAHLHQLHRAVKAGCNVKGYYHWTLVDNFEWAEGWELRFGLFELNVETQERTMRPSGELYQEIIAHNGLTNEMVAEHLPPDMPRTKPPTEAGPSPTEARVA